jgi:hypothetical protein
VVQARRRAVAIGVSVVAVAIGLFLLIDGLSGGGGRRYNCTSIGCTSGIDVVIGDARRAYPRASSVTLCVDGRCKMRSPAASELLGSEWHGVPPKGPRSRYLVEVRIRSRSGATLLRTRRSVTLVRSQPNGPRCGPTCFERVLRLDPVERRLREDEGLAL